MIATRYQFAADLARGKRVLELACGSGQGLGLVARSAARVVAGDVSAPLLRLARAHYGRRVPLARLSAEALPFADGAFDLVLCFEASYYVPRMDLALREIARVVSSGGTAAFVNANPERPDFIKSPHSVRYHTADEFRAALETLGYRVTVAGAFPVEAPATHGRRRVLGTVVSLARRALDRLGLVPRTLKGRARLKRLVYGKLLELPPELTERFAAVAARVPVGRGPLREFKVMYVTATKTASG